MSSNGSGSKKCPGNDNGLKMYQGLERVSTINSLKKQNVNSLNSLCASGKTKDFDILCEGDDIPIGVNISASKQEDANIEECLLDLDDYLEKMDDDCLSSSYEPTTVMAKGASLSVRNGNHSKVNTQFERNSRLRNTTGCIIHKKNTSSQHKVPPVCGSLGRQDDDSAANTNATDKYTDTDGENPCLSTHFYKSGSSKNINIHKLNLENECGNSGLQVLTNDQIFQNLIEQQQSIDNDRPRQLGRRAERFSTFSSPVNSTIRNFGHVNYDTLRAMSAPVTNTIPDTRYQNEILYAGSDGSTTRTSRNTTPISIESCMDSGESLTLSDTLDEQSTTANEDNDQSRAQTIDTENMNPSLKYGFNTYWPYNSSRTFALISCTLGLFNISRFVILTINYGGNFLIQFCILSIIFGIPFLWLQMSLGSKIQAGPISMWKISPICVGIGISITFVQAFTTIYSSVVVVWLLKYIQDIFINKPSYPWSESVQLVNRQYSYNYTNLTESIPDYFNVNVLQRMKLLKYSAVNGIRFHINDRLAFYLVFVWAAVFVVLCKGLKSFGNFILLLAIPIVFLAVFAVKLLCIVDFVKLQNVFSSTEFDDFLVNSKTWSAAAQEAFLTWGLLGASVIEIAGRTHRSSSKLSLRKDAILVGLAALIGLSLSALIGLCLIQILTELGYIYVPGSYENPEHYSSIYHLKSLARNDLISYPTKLVPHYSTFIGEVYRRHADNTNVSGYQVLRYVTELLPAAVSISTAKLSWIWTSIIFVTLFLFGLSQLCVMWKPISCALGNSSSAVLTSCVAGLLLSIPFVTESGITLLHFMDFLLGGAWFIPVLWTAQIFGVFLIRGRPYNGDDLVNDLQMSGSMSAFLALSWNILLPIGLTTLAIIDYKISLSNQFYYWRARSYFNYWLRKAGALTQIGFLLLVPITAIVQIYRYLTAGPPDILDRIQMLYRPLDELEENQTNYRTNRNSNSIYNENNQNSAIERFQNDAPPKYTPPPSYTTATGARLAKLLRQSFRRSIRRILGESERLRPMLSIPPTTQNDRVSQSASNRLVLAEEPSISISESVELENRPPHFPYGRSLSLGRKQILNKCRAKKTTEYDSNSSRRLSRRLSNRPYTAEDVATILRSTTLGRRRISCSVYSNAEIAFRSIENLVQNAEPPNISLTVTEEYSNSNDQNLTSVI